MYRGPYHVDLELGPGGTLMRRGITVIASIVVIGLLATGAVACSSGSEETTSGGEGRDQGAGQFAGEEQGNGGGGGSSKANLTIANFAFSPDSFSEPAGETIAVENADTTTHTFTVDKSDVDVQVDAGDTVDVALKLEPGNYDFHCEIHPSMTGTLEIT
jgi:plastocyanin